MAPTRSPGTAAAQVTALVGGILAMAPATWWLVGLLRGEITPGENLEPLVSRPDISGGVELTIGLVSVAIIVIAIVVLRNIVGDGHLHREWLGVVYPLAALSGYAGMTYRLATAAFVGADVGAGVLLWLAAPFVFVMGVFVAVSAWTLAHHDTEPE
jgi:hypothetical protein